MSDWRLERINTFLHFCIDAAKGHMDYAGDRSVILDKKVLQDIADKISSVNGELESLRESRQEIDETNRLVTTILDNAGSFRIEIWRDEQWENVGNMAPFVSAVSDMVKYHCKKARLINNGKVVLEWSV